MAVRRNRFGRRRKQLDSNSQRDYKLITALRTAVANEYKLDKEVTSFSDTLDAFRLALQFYKRTKG
jgi:hypothetical protein